MTQHPKFTEAGMTLALPTLESRAVALPGAGSLIPGK